MAILPAIVLWLGMVPPGGDPAEDLPTYAELALPHSLADFSSQQKDPLDGVPVEKPKQNNDFANPNQNKEFSKPKQDDNFGRNAGRDDDSLIVNFGVHGRFSVPFGAADRSYTTYYGGYYYYDHYLSWADFFNPGWGFEAEADFFFGRNGPGSRRTPGFNYGLALLVQTDEYYGRSIDDSFGHTLSVDDMTANTIQIGGVVLQTLGNDFYYGGLIALGAVHYSETSGTFSSAFYPSFRDTVFRDTWTFASTFRANGGYRLGPVGITLGMALRILAPPSEGGRFSMNSGAFWTFDLDLGVEIGF